MPPTRSYGRQVPSTSSSGRVSVRRAAAEAATKPSIRLTVKAPPSKLRQALNSSDGDTPEPPVRNARSTRNPRTVIEPDSDDDMLDADSDGEEGHGLEGEDEEDDDGGDGAGDDEETAMNLDDEEEDEDDDEDDDDVEDSIVLAGHPPPPIFRPSTNNKKIGPNITVSVPDEGPLKSVEAKEADMEDLSDLGSDDMEILDDEEEEEDADGLSDSDAGSGSATPDPSKLTRRQRAVFEEGLDGGLMALSNEAQKKKHLTAEEHASRRAEMARRRKNLSEKRNEEEKMDTINKLLSKPAPKRRTRAEMLAAATAADTPSGEYEEGTAGPLYVRWISNAGGSKLGVPAEWLEAQIGTTLAQGWTKLPERKLVEEV